jgi:hypothetical protein
MSLFLTRRSRIKAAITATLLYAVCVLAPSAALALSADAAAHCLTGPGGAAHVHQQQTAPHGDVAAGGAVHEHSDESAPHQHSDADGKSHAGTCCGLFCVTALPHEPVLSLAVPPTAALDRPHGVYELAGRGPDRINRPPIG